MTELNEAQLIKIRRDLHQIPELALQEKQTHDYLLDTIKGFNQTHLEIRQPEKLPTALMVLAAV